MYMGKKRKIKKLLQNETANYFLMEKLFKEIKF